MQGKILEIHDDGGVVIGAASFAGEGCREEVYHRRNRFLRWQGDKF